jgi:LysR family glycine cleavage system transcriptional activator
VVNLINYSAARAPLDFAAEHVDGAIFAATSPWPGTVGHKLMPEDMVTVCAPALLADGRLASIGDLARHTLLQHTTHPHVWRDWLDAQGAEGIDGMRGPEFQHMAMVAEAAAAGLGVALLPRFLITEELASGRLALAFDVNPFMPRSYFLVHPDKQIGSALAAFRDWMLKECAV